jgi:hypothetical protein
LSVIAAWADDGGHADRVSDELDVALEIPGFDTMRDAHRVVFMSTEGPHRTVIWRITAEALSERAAYLRPDAQDAWGSNSARGEWLLGVHVEEALTMFEGRRGEIVMDEGGLWVRPLE